MADYLTYDFRVIGLNAINRALASVERRFAAHNRTMARHSTMSDRAMGRGGARAARGGRSPEVAAAAERQRALARFARIEEREQLRIDREKVRSTERAERQRTAAVARESRRRQMMERREARAAAASRRRFLSRTAGTVVGATGRAVGTVGRFAMGAGTILGGIGAASAVMSEVQAERQAATLASKAFGTPGEKRNRTEIKADVLQQATELGIPTGLGKEGIIAALDKFTAISGRLGMGQQLAPFMADIADATGAAIGDVGRTGGQIAQAMMARGMSQPEAIQQVQEIMTAMAAQAKVGSIEFADLATQMGKVMSSTAAFDGKVSDLATTMGAVSQLAIAGAASSPEEAMTSILRFRDDLIKNQQRFKKQGINVFADKAQTRLRAPEELMLDMLQATKGSLPKVSELFGIRAAKAVTPFQTLYTEKGGGEAGAQAVRDLLATAKATMPAGEIAQSAAFTRATTQKQLEKNLAAFKDAVGRELVPAVTAMIPALAKLTPAFAEAAKGVTKFVQFTAQNPYQGIGAIIGGLVVKDLAAAGIGAVAKATLESALSAGVKGGGLGRAGLTLALATATFIVGRATIDKLIVDWEGEQRRNAYGTAKEGETITKAAAQKRVKGAVTGDTRRALEQVKARNEKIAAGEFEQPSMAESAAVTGVATALESIPGIGTFLGAGVKLINSLRGEKPPTAVEKESARRTAEQAGRILDETPAFNQWMGEQTPTVGGTRDVTGAGAQIQTIQQQRVEREKQLVEQLGGVDFAEWMASMQAGAESMTQLTTAADAASKQLRDIQATSPNRGNSPTAPR